MTQHNYTTEIVAGVYLAGAPTQTETRMDRLPQVINLDLHNPATWEAMFRYTSGTDAGINVTEDSALMYAPVWQAVTLISSAVATMPFHHFRRLPDIGPKAAERVYSTQDYLISVSPSGGIEPDDYTTAVQFWESFMMDALLWNNAYAHITYDRSMRPVSLTLMNPDRTTVERVDGQLWYVTEYGTDGKLKALYPWEVLHIRGLSATTAAAPSFIKYARNSIALGLAQQKFASKFFANGGRVGGILEIPRGTSKPAVDNIEEGFRKSYEGNDNPFRTVILRDSAKFHVAQTSPKDSQMVEGTEEQVRMIARWFGLSPALLGLSGSVSYNSKEQDNQAFLDHCLKRWLRKIEAECGLKLLAANRQQSEFFAHDVSDLLSMNPLQQAQANQIYISSRVKNPNECRAELGLLPYEGGDEFANPNTTTTATSTAAEVEDETSTEDDTEDMVEDDTPEPPEEPRSVRDWRAARVLFHLSHVARHKARSRRSFCEWLDGGMDAQRREWKELAAGEPEPQFFVEITNQFNHIIDTVTETELPAAIDAITTSFERGYHDGT